MIPLLKQEPREAVLFVRVTDKNKRFIARLAEKNKVDMAHYMNYVIDCHRESLNASNKKKLKRRH